MSRVWVTQEPVNFDRATGQVTSKLDYAAAELFGEVVFLVSSSAKPWDPDVVNEIKAKLGHPQTGFRPGDWLLLGGNPSFIAMASALVADFMDGQLHLLQYHGKDQKFVPVTAQMWEPEQQEGASF